MKNICKGLVILCILAGVFIFVPGNAQAAKLTMKNKACFIVKAELSYNEYIMAR